MKLKVEQTIVIYKEIDVDVPQDIHGEALTEFLEDTVFDAKEVARHTVHIIAKSGDEIIFEKTG